MPCNYEIDPVRRLVISKGWSKLTAAEALEHQNKLSSDPNFRPEFCQLLDMMEVSEPDLDSYALRILARRHVFSGSSRRAFLVANPLAMGISRMFQIYRELAGGKEQIRSFSDREEALAWLLEKAASATAEIRKP